MPPFDFSSRIRRYRPDEPLSDVPAAPGIYLLYDEQERIRRMVTTQNLRARASYYLHEREQAETLSVARRESASLGWLTTGSRFETRYAHLRLFREFFPQQYQTLYKLPTPHLLCITAEAYPQLLPLRTPRADTLAQIGPYTSRQQAVEEIDFVNRLLSLRRCDYEIVPHQPYERCLYLQMGSCVAPCDAFSQADYIERVRAAEALLQGQAEELLATWAAERDAAAESLAFEEAMARQEQIQKVAQWLAARPDFLRPLERMTLVVPQRTAAGLDLFLFRQGALEGWERLSDPTESRLVDCLQRWLAVPFERPAWRDMRDDFAFLARWLWSHEHGPYCFVDDPAMAAADLVRFLAQEAAAIAEEGATEDLPVEAEPPASG